MISTGKPHIDILLVSMGSLQALARGTALAAALDVEDQGQVIARLRDLLDLEPDKVAPRKEQLPRAMRRGDVLRELARWDQESLKPLAPTLKALLRGRPHMRPAAELLEKLGYTVEQRRGRFQVVAEPQ